MNSSEFFKQRRNHLGLSISFLLIACVALVVAYAALGEEIINLPENRQELAYLEKRLPELRSEYDTLRTLIGEKEAELENLQSDVDSAQSLVRELPNLKDEEAKIRGEYKRQDREVKRLSEQVHKLNGEIKNLVDLSESEQTRLSTLKHSIENEQRSFEEVLLTRSLHEKQLEDTKQKQIEEQRKLDETKLILDLTLTNFTKEQYRLEQKKNDLDEIDFELNSKQVELDELKTRYKNNLDRHNTIRNDIREALATLARYRDELIEKEVELNDAKREILQISTDLSRLTALENDARLRVDNLIKQLSASRSTGSDTELSQ